MERLKKIETEYQNEREKKKDKVIDGEIEKIETEYQNERKKKKDKVIDGKIERKIGERWNDFNLLRQAAKSRQKVSQKSCIKSCSRIIIPFLTSVFI